MGNIGQSAKSAKDKRTEAQREVVRKELEEIVHEIGVTMRDEGLNYPVYITVPNSGEALAHIATPIDPPDGDWSSISAVVCEIIGKKLGRIRMRSRSLPCAAANVTMGAADVTAE